MPLRIRACCFRTRRMHDVLSMFVTMSVQHACLPSDVQRLSKKSVCTYGLKTSFMAASYLIVAVLGVVAALVVVVGALGAYMSYRQPRQHASASLSSETGLHPSCEWQIILDSTCVQLNSACQRWCWFLGRYRVRQAAQGACCFIHRWQGLILFCTPMQTPDQWVSFSWQPSSLYTYVLFVVHK